MEIIRIPAEVAEQLKYYVYALRDPRTREQFYIGKGIGSRINAHAVEAQNNPTSERAKVRRIIEIEAEGLEVEFLFLRTGIDDENEAFMVEQAVIDALLAQGQELTNLVRGHYSSTKGLASLAELVARYEAKPCPSIKAPVIMLKIQRDWHPGMTRSEIYEKTRGHWRIAEWTRERMIGGYALGIARDIVYGVYRIESWFPSEQPWDIGRNRWGFVGREAEELQHIVGTEVRAAFPNQVMYRRFLDGYVA